VDWIWLTVVSSGGTCWGTSILKSGENLGHGIFKEEPAACS
jgi:hypothetical protein